MTTVVAAAVNGVVHMAADTCTNVYERPIVGGARKVFALSEADQGNGLLVGFCGDGGIGPAVLERLRGEKLSSAGVEDAQAWAHKIARMITEVCVQEGLVDNGRLDGLVLLGAAGRLWTVVHNQAIPHPDGRAAVGSGEGPAIGALDALLDDGVDPVDAVRRACLIAIARDRYSLEPVIVESLTPPSSRTVMLEWGVTPSA